MIERAELVARSHVPLFHTNSMGCHYIDLEGYPWSTFTIYFKGEPHPESCELCGRAITSGYSSPYGPTRLCVGCALHTGECIYCPDCGGTYLWWLADGPAPKVVSDPWDEKLMPRPLCMVAAHCDLCGAQLCRSWVIQAYRFWERGGRPINFESVQLGPAS